MTVDGMIEERPASHSGSAAAAGPMTGHRQSLHALRGNIIRRKILFRSLDKISRRSAAPRPTESTRDFQDLPQRTRFVPGIHSIPPDLVYHSVLMTIY